MARNSPYSVHPSIPYTQKIIANLKTKTGRTIDEWIAFVRNEGPKTEVERRTWLKETHALGTNYAWWIAERAEGRGGDEDDPDAYLRKAPQYVAEMFAGTRAGLKPIYDKLLKLGLATGRDAKACPCKTIVPLYREHVFAEIKPATNTRIDLGLALGKVMARIPARIEPVKGAKGNRITHRIPIEAADDIDDFVVKWLKVAYDADE
jgi:Domain of unknown function (DUF5655)/Domain of unknown function (DUF4287)